MDRSVMRDDLSSNNRLNKSFRFVHLAVLLSVFPFTLISCGSDPVEEVVVPKTNEQMIASKLEKPEEIVFSDVLSLVLKGTCTRCHSPRSKENGVDLSNVLGAFKAEGDRILVLPYSPERSPLYQVLKVLKGDRHMPPKGHAQLSNNQIDVVFQWIRNGAKKKMNEIVHWPPTMSEELQPYFEKPEKIDYKTIKKHVFSQHCNKCHTDSGVQTAEDTLIYSADLTSYQSIFNPFLKIVEKGVPEESKIFRAVAIKQTMPPSKNGYDLLDSQLIKLTRLWILNCAIEDFDSIQNDDLVFNPEEPEKVRLCEGQ